MSQIPATKQRVGILEAMVRARNRPVGTSWRLDETYTKVKETW